MKAIKKLFALGLVVCLLVICCGAAVADTDEPYRFSFRPPYAGSIRTTDSVQQVESGNGQNAYVTKTGSTAETEYVLFHCKIGNIIDPPDDYVASRALHKLTRAGTYSFTYIDGYGGNGTRYYMCGYPSNSDFEQFTATGRWNT